MLDNIAQNLIDLGSARASVKTFKAEAEPGHVYFLRDADGKVERREASPAPRSHEARDLGGLCDFVNRWCAGDAKNRVLIWYDADYVVAVLDDFDSRRHRITVTLPNHGAFLTLRGLERRVPMTQRDLVRLLRIDLNCTLAFAPQLLTIIRTVKISRTEGGHSANVSIGKESIGRQMEAELTGADRIPEQVTLQVPVFEPRISASDRYNVECAIDVDIQQEKFMLVPLPGELAKAEHDAAMWVESELVERTEAHRAQVDVIYGRPERTGPRWT